MARFRSATAALPVVLVTLCLLACSSNGQPPAATTAADTDAGSDARPAEDAPVDDGTDAAEAAVDAKAPAPSLTSLSIGGASLSPAFSSEVHDYVDPCNDGVNALSVAASAGAGLSVSLTRPVREELGGGAVAVNVREDEAIVVEVANDDGATDAYWVRCLPHDFPPLQVERPGTPNPGFYLMSNLGFVAPSSPFAMVLDARGTPVWYRRDSKRPVFVSAPTKNVIAWSPQLGETFGYDPSGKYTLLPLGSDPPRTVATVDAPTDHHELLPTSSGGFMLLAYPLKSGYDLSSRGLAETTVADCVVQEVSASGALLWSWSASEHFDVLTESTFLPVQAMTDGSKAVDAFHCNSIDLAPSGDVLVSARHLDAVFLVSRATGKVLWKLGGAGTNKDGAPTLKIQGTAEQLSRQHDARMLPGGLVSVFDNHSVGTLTARGLELSLDVTAGTATIEWEYKGPAAAGAMGSFRRLDDGARLLGWGTISTAAFTEVDADGKLLMQLSFPRGEQVYRVTKVPLDQLDLGLLRANAGGGA